MNDSLTPLVSVLVPSYNHSQFVKDAILSVVGQNYANVEICIIDDGSRDGSAKVIQKIIDEYPGINIYFRQRENKGVAKTYNELVSMANGDFVVLLASDDKLRPGAIAKYVEVFLRSGCVMVAGNSYIIDLNGDRASINMKGQLTNSTSQKTFDNFLDWRLFLKPFFNRKYDLGTYESFLISNYIGSGPAIKKTILKNVGGFDERFKLEDWPLWLKLSKVGKINVIEDYTAEYRLHGNNSITTMSDILLRDWAQVLGHERAANLFGKRRFLWLYSWSSLVMYFLYKKKFSSIKVNSWADIAWLPLCFSIGFAIRFRKIMQIYGGK